MINTYICVYLRVCPRVFEGLGILCLYSRSSRREELKAGLYEGLQTSWAVGILGFWHPQHKYQPISGSTLTEAPDTSILVHNRRPLPGAM